jgi:hypothetical protein
MFAKTFAKTEIFAKTFAKMITFCKNNFDQASAQFFGGKFLRKRTIFATTFAITKIFAKRNIANFNENLIIFVYFLLFAKMKKSVLVSTLPATERCGPGSAFSLSKYSFTKNIFSLLQGECFFTVCFGAGTGGDGAACVASLFALKG